MPPTITNLDVSVLVSLNKQRYKGFEANVKLQEGTLIAVPEDIGARMGLVAGNNESAEQQPAISNHQDAEKTRKMQMELERKTKKREREKQEVGNLKKQLELEQCKRVHAEGALKAQVSLHFAVSCLADWATMYRNRGMPTK